MIIPSRSAATALAPFALATIASAQRVIFVPASGSGLESYHRSPAASSLVTDGEPPCRRRRLEPWRRRVREMCRAEADARCRDVEDDVSRLLANDPAELVTPMTSSLSDLSREMDSFFDALFAPRQSPQRQRREEDPFESIFNGMLGFSLRAFDEMAAMDGVFVDSPRPDREERRADVIGEEELQKLVEDVYGMGTSRGEGEEEAGAIPEGEDGHPDAPARQEGGDVGEADFADAFAFEEDEDEEEAIPAPLTLETLEDYSREKDERVVVDGEGADIQAPSMPEQAAENVLDFMVASLAQRSVAQQDKDEEGVEELGLPSVHDIPDRLFRLGSDLLSEVRAHRRLTEDGEEEDPRSRARERLARRLTEYRSDLVYHPRDGTLTLYTVHIPPPAFLVTSPSFLVGGGGGRMMAGAPPSPPRSPLGMGSLALDECMTSRFDRGELEAGCHEAVKTFYLAVENRDLVPPPSAEERKMMEAFAEDMEKRGQATASRRGEVRRNDLTAGDMVHGNYRTGRCSIGVLGICFLLATALLVDSYYNCTEEEDDEDEEGGSANEFDYGELPEDDVDNERVFVGVPVQVV